MCKKYCKLPVTIDKQKTFWFKKVNFEKYLVIAQGHFI